MIRWTDFSSRSSVPFSFPSEEFLFFWNADFADHPFHRPPESFLVSELERMVSACCHGFRFLSFLFFFV